MGEIDIAWEKRLKENSSPGESPIGEIAKGLLEMAKQAYAEGWVDAQQNAVDGVKPAHNTGSPKLPSSTEVWNHVCEYSPALRTDEQVAADRRVAKLVYEFIYRQLRAGA